MIIHHIDLLYLNKGKVMRAIFKYEIPVSGHVEIPVDAKILTAQNQGGKICVWAEVETENKVHEVIFDVIGTGWELDRGIEREYLSTVQINDGDLFFHVYKRIK
jgi:hypothetical protein